MLGAREEPTRTGAGRQRQSESVGECAGLGERRQAKRARGLGRATVALPGGKRKETVGLGRKSTREGRVGRAETDLWPNWYLRFSLDFHFQFLVPNSVEFYIIFELKFNFKVIK